MGGLNWAEKCVPWEISLVTFTNLSFKILCFAQKTVDTVYFPPDLLCTINILIYSENIFLRHKISNEYSNKFRPFLYSREMWSTHNTPFYCVYSKSVNKIKYTFPTGITHKSNFFAQGKCEIYFTRKDFAPKSS